MKIEAGKKYETRDGHTAEILKVAPPDLIGDEEQTESVWGVVYENENDIATYELQSWYADGRYFTTGMSGEDIVAEQPEALIDVLAKRVAKLEKQFAQLQADMY